MIPAFIINFNRLGAPRAMVEYLLTVRGVRPIIVDNNSTYPPLLEWYETKPCQLIRMKHNCGNRVVWDNVMAREDEEYIVTDPDLDLSGVPKDFLDVMRRGLDQHPQITRIGLSLEIDDLPDSPTCRDALSQERQMWTPLPSGYLKADFVTTFGLYRGPRLFPGIRTPRPYTARHLPWYYTKDNLPEDERYYLSSIDQNYNRYSTLLKEELCES